MLKEVNRTPTRITLPSLSTATPLNYTQWSYGRWERIHFGVSRWRFHWYNFLLSCWVMFPIWDIWKKASRWWKRCTALDRFYFPSLFFQIVCHRNARMNTPHHISQLVHVLWLVKIAHPIALNFPLNSKSLFELISSTLHLNPEM